MGVRTSYTLTEAKEMLRLWKDCERALSSGQAKAYRVGSREYTSLDLDDIARRIEYFGNVIDSYENARFNTRVKSVVFRDL